jgi:hypothetical protein
MDAGHGTEELGDYGEIVVVLVVCLDQFRTYAGTLVTHGKTEVCTRVSINACDSMRILL